MRFILFFFLFFGFSNSFCQTAQELFIKQVIISRFIDEKPLVLKLQLIDTTDFLNEFMERTGQSIAIGVLTDLIQKSQIVNPNKWSDKELPNSFLINDKKQKPPDSYFYTKYKPVTRADTLELKYLIEKYQEILKEGSSYAYSRPVFDGTGLYALVSVDNGYNLSGRGKTSIYHFSEGKWTELGPIKSWIH